MDRIKKASDWSPDSGDTAWMLTSTALVLLMTIPGLALFYGGMVRKKNVIATVAQSFAHHRHSHGGLVSAGILHRLRHQPPIRT